MSEMKQQMSVSTPRTDWPWLYQKATRGINRWKIGVTPLENGHFDIVTQSGLFEDPRDEGSSGKKRKVDYKLVESRRTIKGGKNIGKANETTVLEQASLEAQSKYQKYVEKGYTSSLDDLKESNSIFLPMLAHPYEKRGKSIVFPAVGQYKLDGIRVMAYIHGDSVHLLSRTGKPIHNFNVIRKDARRVIEEMKRPTLVLDGELYSTEMPFEQLSGLCRLKDTQDEDVVKTMDLVQLWVFDCYDREAPDETFTARYESISEHGSVRKVPMWSIPDATKVDDSLQKCVDDGYEGLILRNDNSPYQLNTRSVNLQKLKRFYDDEFTIVGYSEAKGNDRGTIIFECQTSNGEVFSVRPEGPRELRKKYMDDFESIKGKLLTVKYQELTKSGVPRFPVGVVVRDYE